MDKKLKNILRHPTTKGMLLLTPALIALIVFFVIPILRMFHLSLFDPHFTLKYYIAFFQRPVYIRVMWITVKISLIVTAVCLLVGYPFALVLSRAGDKLSKVFLVCIVLSMCISLLVRNFSWIIILQRSGIVDSFLMKVGITHRHVKLLHNLFSVVVGMAEILLPYMILPIFSVLKSIDPNLPKAAQTMGARPVQAFWWVTFPLSLPGVYAGFLLVFIMSLGYFITPALLGGAKEMMISNMIAFQVQTVLNWHFAASLSMILLVATLVFYTIFNRVVGLEKLEDLGV